VRRVIRPYLIIMEESDFEAARELAIRFIDYAARSRAEVGRRLAKAGYDEELIEAVVNDLQRAGLLDDEEFSRQWVESRARSKKLGRARLASELRMKGVEKETVEEALTELDPEQELAAALALTEKRIGSDSIADPAVRRRLAGYLQRRGYKWETVEQVFARLGANKD
jgi:regulatory protein